MVKYIVKRILYFVPTIFLITLLGFALIVHTPGNPIDRLVKGANNENLSARNNISQLQKRYWQQKLGLHLPLFYFNISSLAMPDTLYKIAQPERRNALKKLVRQNGNWPIIQRYYLATVALQKQLSLLLDTAMQGSLQYKKLSNLAFKIRRLLRTGEIKQIQQLLQEIAQHNNPDILPTLAFTNVKAAFTNMTGKPKRWKNYIPTISFHAQNRYHRWLFGDGNIFTGAGAQYSRGIVRGDFGISYTTKRPVMVVIADRLPVTVFFSLFAILFGYLVSVPLGVLAARHHSKWTDQLISLIIFILYALPNFFVAVLLLLFFANPDYLNFFPAGGLQPVGGYSKNAGFLLKIWQTIPFLVLPFICYAYSAFAFLSRTTRASLLEEQTKDYVRTANAAGLSNKTVVWKHTLRNALLPLITIFANVFPVLLGGSVILETIFGIPGMGRAIFDAVFSKNYPVLIAVFMLSGMLTLAGYLIADILYAFADPRIRFDRKTTR